MEDQVFSKSNNLSDRIIDSQLRPKNLHEFIGQRKVIENLQIMMKASLMRESSLDHILFSGPPGLGKTSLAYILAQELGTQLHVVAGPAIEKKGDLAAILANLNKRDVLFIDEIHRLHISIEEILYSAMEDYRLDIIIGQGPAARTIQIDISEFCLIGATTKAGLLSRPLRDRFLAHLHFNYYEPEELQIVAQQSAKKLGLNLTQEALEIVSQRSRGTPRVVNRILRRVRDYSLAIGIEVVTKDSLKGAFSLLEIDSLGLDSMDRKILAVMRDCYSGGPVGIDALCATLGEEKSTIIDVYEPFLLKEGFIIRTPRGRMLAPLGKDHLDK